MNSGFKLVSDFSPDGDQPTAINALCAGLEKGERMQVLEGVTGSGKTFSIANVIEREGRPTLVLSHNKTLAAQLYAELKSFFPSNAIEYFVSYYDYYQPEAYIPQTDTFIEKDASINAEIERLRLSATNSLMYRKDVVIVASVSCIYGLGDPVDYRQMLIHAKVGEDLDRDELLRRLVDVQYNRNDYETEPGVFRVRGDTVDIFPSYSRKGVRLEFFGNTVDSISIIDPLTAKKEEDRDEIMISPARHFVTSDEKLEHAYGRILDELDDQVARFEREGKVLEAQRIRMRTMYDLEMMKELGFCSGIENYSRHISGRKEGEPPATLIDWFPENFLTVIDESHVTFPQLRGMYNGDQARKQMLVEHGFRLPSAKDNRPMNFRECMHAFGQIICITATPGPYELEHSPPPVQQLIRPTGLLDPPVHVRPLTGQIDDLIGEVREHAERKQRILVTTLTKKTAEDLTDYLKNIDIKVTYLHSDIGAIERVDILRGLRKAEYDCLIGVNLLREGLDLPEVALVAVLDADKEGFLRSRTALIQIAGRAARHIDGKVILYADRITDSMQGMIDVTNERRVKQLQYNELNDVTPRSIVREIQEGLSVRYDEEVEELDHAIVAENGGDYDVHAAIREMEAEMVEAAQSLEYERAAVLRDQIRELKSSQKE